MQPQSNGLPERDLYAELCESVAQARAHHAVRHARHEARKRAVMYVILGLVFLLAIVGYVSRPSYVHCVGFDYQTTCTDARTGAEWP